MRGIVLIKLAMVNGTLAYIAMNYDCNQDTKTLYGTWDPDRFVLTSTDLTFTTGEDQQTILALLVLETSGKKSILIGEDGRG